MTPIPVPRGFCFAAAGAGFKKPGRLDLGVIVSEVPASAAGVFTTNKFQAAPVLVCIDSLQRGGQFRALMANSGQANACTGGEGLARCRESLILVGDALGLKASEILPTSTGVIGQQFDMHKWRAAMPELGESLTTAGPVEFARAIMTTDNVPKLSWRVIDVDGGEVRILGMAKGAGMISPNMATLLGFVTCDAEVDPAWWQQALRRAVDVSFNRVTVDGDTSTNDTILALANGQSGARPQGAELDALEKALTEVCQDLAYMIVEDAEGGTKVARIRVSGAVDQAQAEMVARTIGNSPLVKTALFGCDPNWGRIVAALGRSGAEFEPDHVTMRIGGVVIFTDGAPVQGDMDGLLALTMKRAEIPIDIELAAGDGAYELLASDLTHEYISINADYRT
ncbi:MAG: bifunctional glutamate N-acetyltransferase/amino-acid acetyltransferase ArgJ [Desulfovibrio sp.]|uniref:bifunctional glutamate N-acetyltransferase/amino-acid acetyltransferase ArgJ n=1 Tax=Desulfovibrio sp. 7SRBS1 TaxID=3378064 RepID=UPI003B3C4A7E